MKMHQWAPATFIEEFMKDIGLVAFKTNKFVAEILFVVYNTVVVYRQSENKLFKFKSHFNETKIRPMAIRSKCSPKRVVK